MAASSVVQIDTARLEAAYQYAAAWAEGGWSPESRAYWEGMRDTLAVVLGRTTKPPQCSTDDPAALVLLRHGRQG